MKRFSHDLLIREKSFKLFRSSRQTIEISIRKGMPQITAPAKMPESDIIAFVITKWDWLVKHLATATKPEKKQRYQIGALIPFLGEVYSLSWQEGEKVWIEQKDHEILVTSPKLLDEQQFEGFILRWYEYRAKEILPKMVSQWQDQLISLGFPKIKKLRLGNYKTKWGSLNSVGVMALNIRLVLLSEEQINYVIIHEFCHFKQMNHSLRFWAEVSKLCPNWRRIRREMRSLQISVGFSSEEL